MATGKSTDFVRVSLPLLMNIKDGVISDDSKEDVAKDLKKYIDVLQERLKQTKDLSFIALVDVKFVNGLVYLTIDIRNEQELESIYECLKNDKNAFSDFLSEYFMDKSMEVIANLSLFTEIKCSVSMPKDFFLQCRLNFKRNSNEHENRGSEQTVHNVGIVKEKVEQMEKKSLLSSSNLESNNNLSNTGIRTALTTQMSPGGYPHELRSTSNREFFQKTFLLYYPFTKGWKVKKIQIQSDNKYLNADMIRHGTDLYEFSVALPGDFVQFSYQYICHLRSDSILNLKDNFMGTPPVRSRKYQVDSNNLQRDNWMEHGLKIHDPHKYDEECLTAHLTYILFHCEANVDVNDACFQIEQLCFRKLPRMNAMHILKEFQFFLPTGTAKTRLLFVVVIGNILTNYQQIGQGDLLDKTTARSLLQDLKHFRLKDLPVSCGRYIYNVCLSLCFNVHGKEMCQVEYLNTCFPFYDETCVLQRLQSSIQMRFVIAHDREPIYDCALQLCHKLYDLVLTESSKKAREALDLLLRHLPFNMTLYVTSKLRLESMNIPGDESDLQNVLTVALQVRIETQLIAIKKNKDIHQLYELWKNVTNSVNVSNQSKFEDTLISTLESFPSSGIGPADTVVGFLVEFGFFKEENSKLKLIQVIMESHNKTIYELIFIISRYSDMARTFRSVTKDELQIFSLRYVKNYCTKRNQVFIYFLTRFSRLCDLKHVLHGDFNDVLETIFLGELENLQPKELLQHIEAIDKISETHTGIGTIFLNHFKQILKETTERPDDLIAYITVKRGKPVVETCLSARLVCELLESCGFVSEKSDFEKFLHFISQYQLWIMIFQCTGKYIDIVHMNDSYRDAQAWFQESEICSEPMKYIMNLFEDLKVIVNMPFQPRNYLN